MQIRDHVFLVTGAASGLGAAVARMIAREGGSVVGVDVNRAAGAKLCLRSWARPRAFSRPM